MAFLCLYKGVLMGHKGWEWMGLLAGMIDMATGVLPVQYDCL